MSDDIHKEHARLKKALKLALAVWESATDEMRASEPFAEFMESADLEIRRLAAQTARVPFPSDDTWKIVAEIISQLAVAHNRKTDEGIERVVRDS